MSETLPCPLGHRDRYADGKCRPCQIVLMRAYRRKRRIPRLRAELERLEREERMDEAS